jgi:hypothetical protein
MEIQLRSIYTYEGLVHAQNIYNFPYEYRPNLRVLSLRYLFQYGNKFRFCPSKKQLLQRAKHMFNEFIHQQEVLDIVRTFCPEASHTMINRIRRPNKKTVYSDSQNVHNTKINKSVLAAAQNICAKYNFFDNQAHKDVCFTQICINLAGKYPYLNLNSLEYIRTSVATFGIGISLQDVFLSLWLWIQEHHSNELENRLVEELKEMNNTCTTGHLARLMNVIQGFTNDENLSIRISNKEQYNAIIRQYLSQELRDCTDSKVLDNMTTGSKEFQDFIQEKIKIKLLSWIDEYGEDIVMYIPTIVNSFSTCNIFV